MAENTTSETSQNGYGKYETDLQNYEEEMRHFRKVIDSFLFYKSSAMKKCDRREKDFKILSKNHREMLPNFLQHIEKCRNAIDVNYDFLQQIVSGIDGAFENMDSLDDKIHRYSTPNPLNSSDMDRVRTTIIQFVRDWSQEGAEERSSTYGVILRELDRLYASENKKEIKVLVPGAGLGRLMHDIVRRGYPCQGNEFSLHMLFASNFILNRAKQQSITIYPWVHQTCNVMSNNDPLRPIQIPDIDPSDIPEDSDMSMSAGDFLEVYSTKESWNCVITCFFIDTAHNIITYIEKIRHVLKNGGYWINFGPLLYHFADLPNETSLELTYEDVKKIITKDFNFELLHEEHGLRTSYIDNCKSMFKSVYDCVLFVAKKQS